MHFLLFQKCIHTFRVQLVNLYETNESRMLFYQVFLCNISPKYHQGCSFLTPKTNVRYLCSSTKKHLCKVEFVKITSEINFCYRIADLISWIWYHHQTQYCFAFLVHGREMIETWIAKNLDFLWKLCKYSKRWYKGRIVLMSDFPGKAW